MDCFDNFVDNAMFYGFANEFKGDIKIDQFTRISDTTISWTEHPRLYKNRTPNIFIKLVFDQNNVPIFELTVKFSENIIEPRIFDTAIHAIDYVNNAINHARTCKQLCDEIWGRYSL